jgi:hypothetical protein
MRADRVAAATPRWRGECGLAASLLFLALFLLLAFFVLAAPASAGGPLQFVPGDFEVNATETISWKNQTIQLAGNLTVHAGGSLVMENATLLFDLVANGSSSLIVEAGGRLEVRDLDGLGATTFDRSIISSADAGLRYRAYFQAGANVTVRGSEVSEFGFSLVVPGMMIESSAVRFDNSTVSRYEYLLVSGASPSFSGTTFDGAAQGSNFFFASSARLIDCTFTRHIVGISAGQGSSLTVQGTLVADTTFSIAANGSTVELSNSTLQNSSSGLFLTNGSAMAFTDVLFNDSQVVMADNLSSLDVGRSFTFLVLNQLVEPVRDALVSVANGSSAQVAQSSTGQDGRAGPMRLRVFEQGAAGRYVEANYTVNASRAGNGTSASLDAAVEVPLVTLSMVSNIDPRLARLLPPSGVALLAGMSTRFEVNASDPDATPGGLVVTWSAAAIGTLGTGASIQAALPAGVHTITVEASDGQDGYRSLSFDVVVELGAVAVYSRTEAGLTAWLEVFKASTGGFAVAPIPASNAPVLAVGGAFDFHPSSGNPVWAWAYVSLPFDPSRLPPGVNVGGLHLLRLVGGSWEPVPASSVNLAAGIVSANVSSSFGLGTFIIEGTRPVNVAPSINNITRLVAVRGTAFVFVVTAEDTPGEALVFSIEAAPVWISISPDGGTLAGIPSAADRGLQTLRVIVTDPQGANDSLKVEIFVTGAIENSAPQLVNPSVVPFNPGSGGPVTVQVWYFDADDDPPIVVEVFINDAPHTMEPLDATDATYADGKAFVFRVSLEAGSYNISFRTNDGSPGHSDSTLASASLLVQADALRALDNAFLALFGAVALTVVFIVYLAATSPKRKKAPAAAPEEPEDRIDFLEGDEVRRIEPQPVKLLGEAVQARAVGDEREDDLEEGADESAREAHRIAQEAEEDLEEASHQAAAPNKKSRPR